MRKFCRRELLKNSLGASAALVVGVSYEHRALLAQMRAAAQELGVKAGQMFQPVRVAVCGRKNAPPLFETLEVLGKDKTLARVRQAAGSFS